MNDMQNVKLNRVMWSLVADFNGGPRKHTDFDPGNLYFGNIAIYNAIPAEAVQLVAWYGEHIPGLRPIDVLTYLYRVVPYRFRNE